MFFEKYLCLLSHPRTVEDEEVNKDQILLEKEAEVRILFLQ